MDRNDLSNRFGVVTGAFGPVGRELVSALVGRGATVLAVDKHVPSDIDNDGSVFALEVDLIETDACDRVVEAVLKLEKRVDFLVNNAALTAAGGPPGFAGSFRQQTDSAFDLALALNLAVPYRLARRFADSLSAEGIGTIVNVSSIYGLVGPQMSLYEGTDMGGPAGYAASKGGLIQLTRYLASVMAPKVRVNCVAPGGIERGQDPAFRQRYVERTPLGRMATEKDVVEAILWLMSSHASYVTGQVLAVDGGWTAI